MIGRVFAFLIDVRVLGGGSRLLKALEEVFGSLMMSVLDFSFLQGLGRADELNLPVSEFKSTTSNRSFIKSIAGMKD